MEFKGTKEPWYSAFTADKKRGVRSKGGFIAILPKPSRYQDQDERYEQELTENKADQTLIECAPEMLEMLKEILEQREDGRDYISLSDMRELIKKATTI